MKLEEFQKRVKELEDRLIHLTEYELKWIEPFWFHIESNDKNHSTISIRYEFDEIRIGIDHFKEYYSDKYEEGRRYNDGFCRFEEILYSRIKKRSRFKGNFYLGIDYLVEKNGVFGKFASSMSWVFPFWRKTRVEEFIQNPILSHKTYKS